MIFAVYGDPLITPTLFTPALATSAVVYQGELWTSSHLSIMPASQVHLTTLVIPITTTSSGLTGMGIL